VSPVAGRSGGIRASAARISASSVHGVSIGRHHLGFDAGVEFGSLVSEVLVARHFAAAGFDLAPTVVQTITGVKPEFYASNRATTAGVEVFQPRDWQLIDAFIRKGSQLLVDADIPFDFGASLELSS
jgi:hypothetical protein